MDRHRNIKTLRLLAAAAMAVAICQCAFFNMFYNARTSYDTAYLAHRKLLKQNPDSIIVALPSEIQSNYDRAIDKAQKVLEEFPKNKKWHDDAIFLIGKANFFKGEYEKALRNMKILQEDFPASPFIPESYLYSGKSYLKMENYDKADEMFDLILSKYPELNAEQEVTLLKVEIALSREGKSMAVDLLEKISAKVSSKEKRLELSLKTVRLYMDLKLYDKAIEILRRSPRDKKYPEKIYIIDLLLAGCFEAKDSLGKALEIIDAMLANRTYSWHTPEIQLKKASIFEKMGKIDEALATYTSITEASASNASAPGAGVTGTNASSISSTNQEATETAWFRLGLIYQLKKGDFKKAKECFGKISANARDTVIRGSAAKRIKSIDTLLSYIGLTDTLDTAKIKNRRSAIEFKVGELFWLELDLPDSAFAHFKKLAMGSDSLRPKSLYSAAYIARSALRDTAGSDSMFAILLKNYPANEYTKMAQKERGEIITVHTRQDSAKDAYLRAESLFSNDKNEEAVSAFREVYSAYPDCDQGVKALYAAGWISSDVLHNNKIAYKLYKTLCDSFPQSDICVNQIKPRLKTVSDTLTARKTRGKSAVKPSAQMQGAAKAKSGAIVPASAIKTAIAPGAKDTAATKTSAVPGAKDTAVTKTAPVPPKQVIQNIKEEIKPLPPAPSASSPQPAASASSTSAPPPAASPAAPKKTESIDEEAIDSVEVIGQTK
jgi:tetratricopeptide (TPR) repeat protein